MNRFNIEIKAKVDNLDEIRNKLKEMSAEFKGQDHQIDIYFQVKKGRLKLREGTIERCLVYYERENKTSPKRSEVLLYQTDNTQDLKEILLKLFDIKIVVDKMREIYFKENIKFHLDSVASLGKFVEIEVICDEREPDHKLMLKTCQYYMDLLGVKDQDLIDLSYSDLLLLKRQE
ncbi:class IV adenylate cyclase [candidate division KSB1 bacterium]|nr:class IV adenylate cyclase [candidate division KSB1 bacterium]